MVSRVWLYRNFAHENRLGPERYYVEGAVKRRMPKAESEAFLQSRLQFDWMSRPCQPCRGGSVVIIQAGRRQKGNRERLISVSYLLLFLFLVVFLFLFVCVVAF